MQGITDILEQQPFLVLDGGLATELERYGADLNDPLWSARVLLESPQRLARVYADYLAAGADIITTATYQATYPGLLRRGLSRSEATRIFHLSAELAVDARHNFWSQTGDRITRSFPLIVGSIGPYGAYLADGSEYHGHYEMDRQELIDWHRPQVEALSSTSVDLLAFETIPSLLEAGAIVDLLTEFPEQKAWISFSCRDDRHVSHGEAWAECVATLSGSPQIVAAGINCTDPRLITSLLQTVSKEDHPPFIVYPNSGERWDADRHCWIDYAVPFDLGSAASEWYQAGARIVGGCCRTGPEHIRALRLTMEQLRLVN